MFREGQGMFIYFREPIAAKVIADSADNSLDNIGDSPENSRDNNAGVEKPSGNIAALNLKPNEVVLKKEIFRTEFAPYLSPGSWTTDICCVFRPANGCFACHFKV